MIIFWLVVVLQTQPMIFGVLDDSIKTLGACKDAVKELQATIPKDQQKPVICIPVAVGKLKEI